MLPAAESSLSTAALTEPQEGLWFAQRLDPDNPVFNTGQYVAIEGPLDAERFRAAVNKALLEAQALAIRIEERDGAPVQLLDCAPLSCLRVADVRHAPNPQRAALDEIERDMATPLDLSRDPVVAEWLFAIGDDRHLWYQRVHHVAIDGYGTALLTRRITDLYNAATLSQAGPSLASYPLVLAADADYRGSARRDRDRSFWHAQFADRPSVAGLAQGIAATARTYRRRAADLPGGVRAALERLAHDAASAWPDALVAVVAAYLQRHTRTAEVVLGVPTMDRMGTPAARVPAMVMNVLPVRILVDENLSLVELVKAVSARLKMARRHGRYRSEQLRRDLGLVGGTRRLFGPLVNVLPFDDIPQLAGVRSTLHTLGTGPVDDITITFRAGPAGEGLRLEIDANPDLYSETDLDAHAARLAGFVAAALEAERLSSVPTLTPTEERSLISAVNDTDHPVEDTTLTALIERAMARCPSTVAVELGADALTYRELEARSGLLVQRLRAHGVSGGDVVVICLPRSLELMVALVSVLRAGAAYLPIEVDHPRERVAAILDSARPRVVLTTADQCNRFDAAPVIILKGSTGVDGDSAAMPTAAAPSAVGVPAISLRPGDAAYVIYTSGSTGTPKGVVIDHRAIVNRLEWMRCHYGIRDDDRILQKTPITFDVSVWELFLPLISGATLVMAPPDAHKDPAWLATILRGARITTAHFVPSMLAVFLGEPSAAGLAMRRVFSSGEALPAALRDRFHEIVSAELHNLYGPTEAAVDVTYWGAARADRSSPVPIGWPVWNTQMHVLDRRFRPVPPGVAGDLYIAGIQLAREYLGRPDLTAERFVPCPLGPPGGRMYHTGDVAERRADGAIVFLGRSDHQIKIRGRRVELGEIEAAITSSGMTRSVAVVAREDRPGDQRIVAYLVAAAREVDVDALRAHVAAVVPDYMVPSAFVSVDALPLSSNGKLQHSALPAPTGAAAPLRAPRTDTEAAVARLFADVLATAETDRENTVGADQDFFELGGHSLTAATLIQRIRREWRCDLGLGAVFAYPTVSRLAAHIDAVIAPAATGHLDDRDRQGLGLLIHLAGDRDSPRAPLFCVHPAGGISWCYAGLGRALAHRRPLFGLQARGLDPSEPMPPRLDDMAAEYAEAVRRAWPSGPYHLLGWSVGGILAHAIAVHLQDSGATVATVAMLDTYPSDRWRDEPEPDAQAALRALLLIAGHDPRDFPAIPLTRDAVVAYLRAGQSPLGALPDAALSGVVRVVSHNSGLVRQHHHRQFHGPLLFFSAGLDHVGEGLSADEWKPHVSGAIHRHDIASLHAHMTGATAVPQIALLLEQWWAGLATESV